MSSSNRDGRRKRQPKWKPGPKPKKSRDTALADAVAQKYTELADHLLKSETINAADGSDAEGTQS